MPGEHTDPTPFLRRHLCVVLGDLGGQGEVGWRGYIMEPLETRYGVWRGNVALGLVWSVWHLPLWFVEGSSQASLHFVAFTIGFIGLSFFFSWLVKAAGGRPLAGLVGHGTSNAIIALFPTIAAEADASQLRWWLHQTLLLVVGALFLLHCSWHAWQNHAASRRTRSGRCVAASPGATSWSTTAR
jgi:hypothetical protein